MVLLAVCSVLLACAGSPPGAAAAFDDPTFVFKPVPPPFPAPAIPPPESYFEGPCGLAVDDAGNYYIADHLHNAVDVFGPDPSADGHGFITQLPEAGALAGPCGLALDSGGHLYVNEYHRAVTRFGPRPAFGTGTAISSGDPTGVAVDRSTDTVWVTDRTHIAAYDSSGAPLEVSGQPVRVGEGTLVDGYGLAASGGRLYVADAGAGDLKVYEPSVDAVTPALVIDGDDIPGGGFTSLRDAAIAVDDVSGVVYVVDNLQPLHTEEPEAAVRVFSAAGAYLGRLKHNIVDGLPSGLAVDNSSAGTQGRVYVTSGNTEIASLYAYPAGAATTSVMPASKQLGEAPEGTPLPAGGAGFSLARTGEAVAPGAGPRRAVEPMATGWELSQKGSLRLALNGELAPRKLPRQGVAPVAVSIDWHLGTTDGSPVPRLKKVRIEINRHGSFDYTGLPTCAVDRIQPASTRRALAACRSALVGRGSFEADISLAGQENYATRGTLLVFNGVRHGRPVLLGQIYSPRPFATSFVITFEVERLNAGVYGTALTATLPKALSSWGNLTSVGLRLGRRYGHEGTSRSYLSAGCPAPRGFGGAVFPLVRTTFSLAGGMKMSQGLTRSCRVR